MLKKDERSRVVNKVNEGVAIAKKYRDIISRGEYIGLVDLDDWMNQKCMRYCIIK